MIKSGYKSMNESAGSSSTSKKMSGIKSKKGLGNYNFKFSAFRGTKLRIDCTYNYFDQRDYAFFDPKTKKITSYSDSAADFVVNSLADAGIDTTQLSKLANELIK